MLLSNLSPSLGLGFMDSPLGPCRVIVLIKRSLLKLAQPQAAAAWLPLLTGSSPLPRASGGAPHAHKPSLCGCRMWVWTRE